MAKSEISLVPADQIPKAAPVPADRLMDACVLAIRMEWLCGRESGIGLSAVQVGVPWDLFVVRRGPYEHYINCSYEGIGDLGKAIEGCLSLRNKEGKIRSFEVERYTKVRVRGKRLRLSEDGSAVADDVELEEEGVYAVVFQHEIDHGQGILISDKGREIEVF